MPMQCPYCGTTDLKVIDSRESKGQSIRRRRQCCNPNCRKKFTTYEHIRLFAPVINKGDFDPFTLQSSLVHISGEKPLTPAEIRYITKAVENDVQLIDRKEISAQEIIEKVLACLAHISMTAFIDYAAQHCSATNLGELFEFMSQNYHGEEITGIGTPSNDEDDEPDEIVEDEPEDGNTSDDESEGTPEDTPEDTPENTDSTDGAETK